MGNDVGYSTEHQELIFVEPKSAWNQCHLTKVSETGKHSKYTLTQKESQLNFLHGRLDNTNSYCVSFNSGEVMFLSYLAYTIMFLI